MSTFRSPSADREPLERFRASVPNELLRSCTNTGNTLPLHIFEWPQNSQFATETSSDKVAVEQSTQNQATIRVLTETQSLEAYPESHVWTLEASEFERELYVDQYRFAPRDVPMPSIVDGMVEFFETHEIPSAFVAESLQQVSQSFAVQTGNDTTNIFFHLLVKDISMSAGRIVQSSGSESAREAGDKYDHKHGSQANFNWLKPGFVLRIRNERPSSPPQPSRATTSSSDVTLTSPSGRPAIELFCFGAPASLGQRFRKLKDIVTRDEIEHDPYMLLEIVLDEMYKTMDRTAWIVADIFGKIEQQTLERASNLSNKKEELPDFQGLHNIAKHNIYLRENCESALATLSDLRDHHNGVIGNQANASQEATKQALKYQKTLLQSTQRRLDSLDRRIANIIQLSFNMVTQRDSRIMLSESQSMKTIAVTTLIFLPLSTVAGVFGTEFIQVGDGPGTHITVSEDFWLLWVIAAPLTIVVFLVWRLWYRNAKRRFIGREQREAGRHRWGMLARPMRDAKDEKVQCSVTTREVYP